MTLSIKVEAKVVGRPKRPFGVWDVSLPIDKDDQQFHGNLRELITLLVKDEVKDFHERQEKRRLSHIMTPAEISLGVESGKVVPGEQDLDQTVDLNEAIQTAHQAFEDGLYYVFIDHQQIQDLNTVVEISEGSLVSFIRLVALAGG